MHLALAQAVDCQPGYTETGTVDGPGGTGSSRVRMTPGKVAVPQQFPDGARPLQPAGRRRAHPPPARGCLIPDGRSSCSPPSASPNGEGKNGENGQPELPLQ